MRSAAVRNTARSSETRRPAGIRMRRNLGGEGGETGIGVLAGQGSASATRHHRSARAGSVSTHTGAVGRGAGMPASQQREVDLLQRGGTVDPDMSLLLGLRLLRCVYGGAY